MEPIPTTAKHDGLNFILLFHDVPVLGTKTTVGESHVVEISKAGDVNETRIWTVLKTVFP
jgi:hypothetical protein